MTDQKQIDYERIENAIHFIRDEFKSQPSLEEIAEAVQVSSFHFQRMFRECGEPCIQRRSDTEFIYF